MTEQVNNNIESSAIPPRRHKRPKEQDSTLKVRQWLNAIFMLGAIIGVIVYFAGSSSIGTIIILAAMVFKIVECAIRFIH